VVDSPRKCSVSMTNASLVSRRNRTPFDPRLMFAEIEAYVDQKASWQQFWEGLHHQGDVG
jgi:hypothetical protein